MKRLNFNAVRCSHYPNHPLWYEVCSKLGLYVVGERPLLLIDSLLSAGGVAWEATACGFAWQAPQLAWQPCRPPACQPTCAARFPLPSAPPPGRPADEANVETHGFDPGLCNNHLNPACSPLWLNAIVGARLLACGGAC